MRVQRVGIGAGGRDPAELPNVVRLVLGEPGRRAPPAQPVVLETNVDDLDPRLWPGVLDALFAAGASDAWLTPILMKKGRPAHTLSALCRARGGAAVQAAVFAATSTIGLRIVPVGKVALERAQASVDVLGGRVGVKVAVDGGRVVNVSVEYEDVAALARELRPAGQGGAAGGDGCRGGRLSGHCSDAAPLRQPALRLLRADVLDPGHDRPAVPERVVDRGEPVAGDEGGRLLAHRRPALDGLLEDGVDVRRRRCRWSR